MSAPAFVYRAFDARDRLLYVGCSVDVDARLRYHEQHAAWWIFATRIDRQEFASHELALAAEAEAISEEHPRWNIVGRSASHPDGYISRIQDGSWLSYERDVARRFRDLTAEEASLIRKVRRVRMALAGVNAEVAAINAGVEINEVVA